MVARIDHRVADLSEQGMRAVHIAGFQQRDGNAVRHGILFWINT